MNHQFKFKSTAKHVVNCPQCGGRALDHMTECPSCGGILTPKGYASTAAPEKYRFLKRGVGIVFWIAAAAIAIFVFMSDK